MVISRVKSQILQCFIELSRPMSDPPLGFLEIDDNAYLVPSEPERVLDALEASFAIDQLLESGSVVMGEQGKLALMPGLEADASFIVLRERDSEAPFNCLKSQGCLTKGVLPVFEVLHDHRTRELLENGAGQLFVAFDLESVRLLRSCGLPATLAVGMEKFPLDNLDRFDEAFIAQAYRVRFCMASEPRYSGGPPHWYSARGRSAPGDPEGNSTAGDRHDREVNEASAAESPDQPVESQPPVRRLVLLGWPVSDLSMASPWPLNAVVNELRRLERYMWLHLTGIWLWEVKEETIERLRFVASRGHAASFQQALCEETDENQGDIDPLGKEPVSAPVLPRIICKLWLNCEKRFTRKAALLVSIGIGESRRERTCRFGCKAESRGWSQRRFGSLIPTMAG